MGKRKRYDDEFRAGAILQLEAAGYPNQKGALLRVSRSVDVPTRTLRRWWKGTSNPVPANVVLRKKGEIIEKLDSVAHLILDSIDLETVDHAQLRERTVALGIVVDKGELLKGNPTERTEHLTKEQRVDRVTELFERARTRRAGKPSNTRV